MTTPCLPGLFTVPETVKPRRVRETSVAVYHAVKNALAGRKAEVLRWLEWYRDRHQESPTSAELHRAAPDAAADCETSGPVFLSATDSLLYIRRGISDLQAVGLVEAVPQGKRPCRVSGRTCETWRVRQR